MLPRRKQIMSVQFDKSGEMALPMAESCFSNLTIPVKHTLFQDFTKNMDLALKYGSKSFCFS